MSNGTENISKVENEDNNKSLIVDILLNDISQRKDEMNLREKAMLSILTAYLAGLFIIVGIFFDKSNDTVFLIIPAFLASGVALILHQQKIIYTLGAYIGLRENDINSIVRGEEINNNYLKYEKIIDAVNSNPKVLKMDKILMFITFFPILGFYFKGIFYLYKKLPDLHNLLNPLFQVLPDFLQSIIIRFINYETILLTIYIMFLIIIVYYIDYLGKREFYKVIMKLFEELNNDIYKK